MKNPLSIFYKVFRTTMETMPLTEAVTLEFCYDHVNEDCPGFNQDELLRLQQDEFQPLRIQETE
jgi:phenylalanyl-tRNA synthetase beta subunit